MATASSTERHEYTASLRVFSYTLSLAELTAALGEPTDGHDRRGSESARRPFGSPKQADARWGRRAAAHRTQPLHEHIAELVSFIENHRDALAAIWDDVDVDIFCGLFTADAQGGFELDPVLLRRLGDVGVPVVFDLY